MIKDLLFLQVSNKEIITFQNNIISPKKLGLVLCKKTILLPTAI